MLVAFCVLPAPINTRMLTTFEKLLNHTIYGMCVRMCLRTYMYMYACTHPHIDTFFLISFVMSVLLVNQNPFTSASFDILL